MKRIITGMPRSGTTLALELYMKGRSKEDKRRSNEPRMLTDAVNSRDIGTAAQCLQRALAETGCVKSPELAMLLPAIGVMAPTLLDSVEIVVVHRDPRLIAASVLNHHNATSITSNHAYWRGMITDPDRTESQEPIVEVLLAYITTYTLLSQVRARMKVLNYGLWSLWPNAFYTGRTDDPPEVANEEGITWFSAAHLSLDRWEALNPSPLNRTQAIELAQTVEDLFARRGLLAHSYYEHF